MEAISTASFSVGSTLSSGSTGRISQTRALNVNFNTNNQLMCFNGLKASSYSKCGSRSSFLDGENSSLLKDSYNCNAQIQRQRSYNIVLPQASYKVAILGAAGGIGQPLSLLVKMSPLVSALNLYDIANVKGVAADISHCNTPSKVSDFTGEAELAECLKGVNVVVIPAGVPRKPNMTRVDLFNINVNIVKTLVEAVADNCPDAFCC